MICWLTSNLYANVSNANGRYARKPHLFYGILIRLCRRAMYLQLLKLLHKTQARTAQTESITVCWRYYHRSPSNGRLCKHARRVRGHNYMIVVFSNTRYVFVEHKTHDARYGLRQKEYFPIACNRDYAFPFCAIFCVQHLGRSSRYPVKRDRDVSTTIIEN